jgi:hypothetical protein
VCVTHNLGGVTSTVCMQVCFNPGAGQGVCRAGYICRGNPNGGSAFCGPRCENESFSCPGGGFCDPSTGYCF